MPAAARGVPLEVRLTGRHPEESDGRGCPIAWIGAVRARLPRTPAFGPIALEANLPADIGLVEALEELASADKWALGSAFRPWSRDRIGG